MAAAWSSAAPAETPAYRAIKPVDELQTVTLAGNVHPLARPEFDRGPVSGETRLERMVLALKPSAEQQAALDALVEAQHDPASPLYRRWLTPAEYGARFGAGAQDLARVTAWLEGHGFSVEEIPASNRLVIFSGTAEQVAETFHAEIHSYRVNELEHVANAQDPQIPAALAGVVDGVVSLHDFRHTAAMTARRALEAQPLYSSGATHYLFPADYAAIYDLNPLYIAGTTGSGTSIAIVGRSNIDLGDVATFRSTAGLAANAPAVIFPGANPGLVAGDRDESTLDVEWAGALAPAAAVKFVAGASTATTDGVDLAAQYIVNHATAPVVSTSYGSCEQDMGTTELAFYNSLWEQAASQGMSSFVASGDAGAAGCNLGSNATGSGTAVNGLCSSPYSTCVGGTEFNEGSNSSQYWSSTNSASQASALGYIPERVWNESASNGGTGLWASGGGASQVYAQPGWQKGVSGASAANGMRAVPDVSMSAAGHDGYVIYESGSYWIIAGTSAAAPSFAGVMALLVQSKGGIGQGNANAGLYPLLNAAHNPFHATPAGDNSVPGVAGYIASGASYNLATGLGSVDGAALVSSWGSGSGGGTGIDFALTASAASGTVLTGNTATFSISVTESGAGRNAVTIAASAPAGLTVSVLPATILPGTQAAVTITAGSAAAAGTQTISFTGTDASGSQSLTYALTVAQPPTLALTGSPTSVPVVQGGQNTAVFTIVTGGSFSGSIGLSVSGLPAGVTAQWAANPLTPASSVSANGSTLTLAASSSATAGSAGIVVTATGDGLVSSRSLILQVQQAPGISLSVSPAPLSMLAQATATVTVTATPLGGLTVQTVGSGGSVSQFTGLRRGGGRPWNGPPLSGSPPAGPGGTSISLVSGLPAGFSASWSNPTVTATGAIAWTLTLTGSANAAAGATALNLSAQVTAATTGTVYTASQSLPMTVTATPPAQQVVLYSTFAPAPQDLEPAAIGGGIVNKEDDAPSGLPAEVDSGKLPPEESLAHAHELLK